MIAGFGSIGVLLIAVVILMLISVISDRADARWFARNGVGVNGELVNVRARWTNTMVPVGNGTMAPSGHRRYVATVRFTTTADVVIETETKPSSRRPGRPGDRVQISYDPSDPNHVRLLR